MTTTTRTSHETFDLLERPGYPRHLTIARDLPDGRIAWVHRLMFTNAILVMQRDRESYDDRWCYELGMPAILALSEWNPEQNAEPTGWHRNPKTGRRRPGGDASKEYIEF